MGPEIVNKLKDSEIHGDFVGRDNINVNIVLFQDSEREFVVTHKTNIKSVSYFTGRETELQELRQRIENGRKSVLVSGMGGIGKTHICRKLFEEYVDKHENGSFQHIGYIEYDGEIDSSLQRCLKFKRQNDPEKNQEAVWKELEYLASSGKLLLFVDNVNVSIGEDPNLKQLMSIPGAIILTSRRRVFSKEFEPYRIGFLSIEQCKDIYEKIRYENSDTRITEEEVPDLEYIIIPFAENMIEKLGMGNNLEQVNFISTLAHLLFNIAEYKKAEALYKGGLEIREKVLGEEHPDTATSYQQSMIT